MPKGGKRPNSGRKPGTAWAGPKGPRSKSYMRLMEWADQLWNLNTTTTKKEAARIYAILLAHDEPKLTAVAATTEHRVTYVARIPAQVLDVDEWQKTITPLLIDKK